ncbi:MAG: class I SAM-dependent methyltransferase [Pseudomonadota bacterium]
MFTKPKKSSDRAGGISGYAYDGDRPATADQDNPISDLFWNHDGAIVHKWHHYLEVYDRYFSRFRGTNFRFLEIGVFKGGSLEMWRKYFGDDATIFGIDIEPTCIAYDGNAGRVRIGSQADPEFLKSVVEEMGGVDAVLDDGSHRSEHIRASFNALYPMLADNGVYMIEDLHATYWTHYGGGYQSDVSFMSEVKQIIDDMHHWYHDYEQAVGPARNAVSSMHIHDSIVVLEKKPIAPPKHSKRGRA